MQPEPLPLGDSALTACAALTKTTGVDFNDSAPVYAYGDRRPLTRST